MQTKHPAATSELQNPQVAPASAKFVVFMTSPDVCVESWAAGSQLALGVAVALSIIVHFGLFQLGF
jgi:hypothetical protein